jgi:hypothetical protein
MTLDKDQIPSRQQQVERPGIGDLRQPYLSKESLPRDILRQRDLERPTGYRGFLSKESKAIGYTGLNKQTARSFFMLVFSL